MNKGIFDGICNRTVCDNTGARYYNHSTRMYYCEECAGLINQHNKADAMRMYGHDLCTLDDIGRFSLEMWGKIVEEELTTKRDWPVAIFGIDPIGANMLADEPPTIHFYTPPPVTHYLLRSPMNMEVHSPNPFIILAPVDLDFPQYKKYKFSKKWRRKKYSFTFK